MICALIRDNIVVAVEDIPDEEVVNYVPNYQQIVDVTDYSNRPGIGWVMSANAQFSPPPAGGGKPNMCITKLAFQNRFTDAEFMSILAYADNTAAPYCYAIRMLLTKQQNSTFIDLTRADTIRGMGLLVLTGLLTPERSAEILTTAPTAVELYKGLV